MKFLVQRVREASCTVEGQLTGKIDKGFLVLIGIGEQDTEEIADRMIRKLLSLRIFADTEGKTNLNLEAAGGALLLISQFTLYADCRKGNRPSFVHAGGPEKAERLYEYILSACGRAARTERGIFGADMSIALINDGPFTVMLDSAELFPEK